MIYISSDWHFFHSNIVKYCNRPFSSVEEMDQTILDRLNSRVRPQDTLYFLGDFCWWGGSAEQYAARVIKYRSQIHCQRIFYILGNHCRPLRKNLELQKQFISCSDYIEFPYEKNFFVLFHYPISPGHWNKARHGSYHGFGHCHHLVQPKGIGRSADVGVDANNFYPLSIEEFMDVCKANSLQENSSYDVVH